MKKAYDTLDEQTSHELRAAVFTIHEAFDIAAKTVDKLFPNADPVSRKELIKAHGMELIEGAGIALEYDFTSNEAEGQVSEMLKAACHFK